MRLPFASVHSYLDPSSGAALCTREFLELLARRGIDCRVLCTSVLDDEPETSLEAVLATLVLPARVRVDAPSPGECAFAGASVLYRGATRIHKPEAPASAYLAVSYPARTKIN
jgi:hypothetical protein